MVGNSILASESSPDPYPGKVTFQDAVFPHSSYQKNKILTWFTNTTYVS